MKILNKFWCWVVLRQLRQKFHHFCTIFKDSCTLCNIISLNSEIEKHDQGKQTIAPSLHRMGSLKEYERFMLWKITIDWWKRCVCWLWRRAAWDQRSSSIKQRQKIVLRGRPAPPRLGPRPWRGGRGKLARAVQEWQQVVGIHVVQLQNYTLNIYIC